MRPDPEDCKLLPFSMKMARVTPRSRNWIFRVQPSTCEISTTNSRKDINLVYLESYKRGDIRPIIFSRKKSNFEQSNFLAAVQLDGAFPRVISPISR